MSKKDEIVIYWSPVSLIERQTFVNLLWDPPKTLVSVLPPGTGNSSYRSCSAAKQQFRNTYVVTHPVDNHVVLSGDTENPEVVEGHNAGWFAGRAPLKNHYRINYDFTWIFFSEESVKIRLTPPYMHNTSDRSSGFIASGAYDISKWFRGITITYILWPGVTSLKVSKGDPAFYIEFDTDKKVVLKQFDLNSELLNISTSIAETNTFVGIQGLSLQERYQKFTLSNRHKKVLKLIKENLVE